MREKESQVMYIGGDKGGDKGGEENMYTHTLHILCVCVCVCVCVCMEQT